MKTITRNFNNLPIGAIFFADAGRLVSFRKTAAGVTFGCVRGGRYCYRRSALYGPASFAGQRVEINP